MINVLIWGFIYLFIAAFIFGAGYLFAAREFGKDVKFYKDCIRNQRTVIQAQNSKGLKTLEEHQVAEHGLRLWIEGRIDTQATVIAGLTNGTLQEAFERGVKFGLQAVLLHLKGYL